jgi:hypothetical protein
MTTTRLLTTLLVAGSLLAACGGDDDSDDAASTEPASESTEGPATEAPATAAPAAATGATDATPGTDAPVATAGAATAAPAGDRFTDCPDAAELAPLYGSELRFLEDQAMTGAVGLVFCPYVEVPAPGTTNAFGGEPIPDEFSITFTDQNIVVDEGEDIPGLGDAAVWNGNELAVWTGDQGMIVSIVFDPPAGDVKTVSIAIAQQVLS